MKHTESSLAALNDLAVIEVSGEDAALFLNGQLTQDVANLAQGRACLAGYCTAKGRLLASLVVWPEARSGVPRLRALVKADLAQALVKRLSMFVLRAKATLAIETAAVIGVSVVGTGNRTGSNGGGDTSSPLLYEASSFRPDAQAYDTVISDSGTWIAAPSATAALKRWWFVPASSSAAPGAVPGRQADWQADDVEAGLPWIEASTQDLFIPQTLNLDLIDGVSFTKGCYPGQEVVARSHYRGTIKRRMARGVVNVPPEPPASDAMTSGSGASASNARGVDTPGVDTLGVATPGVATPGVATPGADIFDARAPENPCGRVINAAQSAHGTTVQLLMEVQLADLDVADFRLAGPDGAAIELLPLPYKIKTAS